MAGGVQRWWCSHGCHAHVPVHVNPAERIYTSVLVDLDCPRVALDNSTTWDAVFPSSCQVVILSTQLFKGKALMAQLTWPQRGQRGQ